MRVAHLRAGLVDSFAEAGALEAADVHVARLLARVAPEADERVLLAAALAVRAVRNGAVCVDLLDVAGTVGQAVDDADGPALPAEPADAPDLPWPEPDGWLRACTASHLVATASEQRHPLHLSGTRLYLDRYWADEQQIRAALTRWGRRTPPEVDAGALRGHVHRFFTGEAPDHQRLAAAAAATGWFTVVAGGPGTGKTTTVARLLATLQALEPRQLRVALAAPTGKAAARLQDAVTTELARLEANGEPVPGPFTASTVHRLLGARPDRRTRFRRNRTNHLPHDVVVVDEASMLPLTLVARLLEALRPDTRLVLVGDPDQLVSVEAGAVLGDIVHRAPRPGPDARTDLLARLLPADVAPHDEVRDELRADVVRLRTNHRFDAQAALVDLADAVRRGDADAAAAVLQRGDPALEHVDVDASQAAASQLVTLRQDVIDQAVDVDRAARAGDAERALEALGRHRLLCAHREGRYGVTGWGTRVFAWLAEQIPDYGRGGEFYLGRPLLITANDYDVGLFNGDMGVVVVRDDRMVAAFGADGPLVQPSRLSAVQTPHAMTVHKAQGSEADGVTVVLPPPDSPLLTRELLYTAITRARSHVRVIGTEQSIRQAVGRPIQRASGLRDS